MTGTTIKVVSAVATAARMRVVVAGSAVIANAIDTLLITDIFGTPLDAIVTVNPETIDAVASLTVDATIPLVDPDSDAPSYLLSLAGEAVWFTTGSPRALATANARATAAPPGIAAIDYSGRDFTGFTEMMRGRISNQVEDDSAWALDHPADPLTTIVEVLAYAGDHLSFRQDAGGTESYLTTARRRLSLSRHARLRDYAVNDGCNARTALAFEVSESGTLPAGLPVLTLQPGQFGVVLPEGYTPAASTTVFETMHALPVSALLNDMGNLLTQSEAYVLPVASVSATLSGTVADLVPGQLLILEQLKPPAGAATAFGAQALRLLLVEPGKSANGSTITTISWHVEDALQRPLTVPGAGDEQGMVSLYANVAIADHGATQIVDVKPATVPDRVRYGPEIAIDDPVLSSPLPGAAAGYDGTQTLDVASLLVPSATLSLTPDPATATVCVALTSDRAGMPGMIDNWYPQRDLLSIPGTGRMFAVSPEDGAGSDPRRLFLQFGDGGLGRAPAPGATFTATARSGGGQSGRVRANSLVQVIGPAPIVTAVTNPLPAQPAPAEESQAIRLFAANGFRTNVRGIDPADWERIGRADPLVTEITASAKPDGSGPCSIGLTTREPQAATFLVASGRLMARSVLGAAPAIQPGTAVHLNIAFTVYCRQGANIAAARERLLRRVGAGLLADGSPAHFHPANWPLGRRVILDELIASIQADPAVSFVVTEPEMDPRVRFETIAGPADDTQDNLDIGEIPLRPWHAARVANDGFQPELGMVQLYVVASS